MKFGVWNNAFGTVSKQHRVHGSVHRQGPHAAPRITLKKLGSRPSRRDGAPNYGSRQDNINIDDSGRTAASAPAAHNDHLLAHQVPPPDQSIAPTAFAAGRQMDAPQNNLIS